MTDKPPEGPAATVPEEHAIRAALEEARQTVKPLVKKELEAERITADVLSVRLGRSG
jgi:hypothetical protein